MMDLRRTIAPKSDQLNADDLIGLTKTIQITRIELCSEPDQPVAIFFEGDGGKPFKPCKSMRRVLVNLWGADAKAYTGRSLTLYRDDKVMFGGVAVGGIRISHASGIAEPVTMALTATRASRKPFTVRPLAAGLAPQQTPGIEHDAGAEAVKGMAALEAFWNGLDGQGQKALKPRMPGLKEIAREADAAQAGASFHQPQNTPASRHPAQGPEQEPPAGIAPTRAGGGSHAKAAIADQASAEAGPSVAFARGVADRAKGIPPKAIPQEYRGDLKQSEEWRRGYAAKDQEMQAAAADDDFPE